MNQLKSQNGQMLLIVVLVMVVALTVALSVATRSITNVKISKQNEESQRAFQAAEAGLELNIRRALEGNNVVVGSDQQFNNNASFKVEDPKPLKIDPIAGDYLNSSDQVLQDRGIDLWLMDYDKFKSAGPTDVLDNAVARTVKISWWPSGSVSCTAGTGRAAALEILLLKGTNKSTALQIEKYVYDKCGQIGTNNLLVTEPGKSIGTDQFKFRGTLNVTNGIVMKIVPIYNPTKIYAEGNLPSQGKVISSEGKAGETVRKLEYTQFFPELPTEMFYALLTQ